ncbi:hypothetical protein IAR50_001618 [Cryptococcus sp. DSM 104548]
MDTTASSPSFYPPNYANTPQQHHPYPSPFPTHINAPNHTPLTVHRRPPPVHQFHHTPNGASPQLPMTPPYAAFQYPQNSIPPPPPPHQASPQSPGAPEALPSNHIHVIQTTPQAQPPQTAAMFRTNSTMSTTSTNRPPALSNGPSPTGGEEVIADMSDQSYEGFPPGTSQQHARMVQQQQQQSQRGEPGEPHSAGGRWAMPAPGQQAAHLWQR